MIASSPSLLHALLERTKTIAVVGASANPLRPSYTVFSYLRTQTPYDVTPINPAVDAIDGVAAHPSLATYAAVHGAPDIVDVFRKPSDAVGVVEEAIAAGAKAVWFQYGVVNHAAIELADRAGLTVVVDRCLKVEYARLSGGLATSGLNSGVITSRRQPPSR
jgi:hypothetical protein